MKVKEKKEAIKFRKEQGLSIGDIAYKLNVSKGSVSRWVRDIVLTKEQQDILNAKNPIFDRYNNASKIFSRQCQDKRQQYQNEGRELFQSLSGEKRDLCIIGCMLYWAEGSKGRTTITFCNSDVYMIRIFIKFMKAIFNIGNKDIALVINCYTDCHSIQDIEKYWLTELSLPQSSVRKHTVNYYNKLSQNKRKKKLPYGVCRITVCGVQRTQQLFGAIKEIIKLDDQKKWLD